MPPRLSRLALPALAALAAMLAGCSQSDQPAAPGPEGAANAAAGSAAGASRYRIDRAQAGSPLPGSPLTAPDGSRAALTSLVGKPVLLNLWATWCAPCIEELPTLAAVARANGDRAHMIALSQDLGDADVPNRFLADRGWTILASWHDPENAVGLASGDALPITILYNAAGQETARVIGPMDWTGAKARALLAEAGIAPAAD